MAAEATNNLVQIARAQADWDAAAYEHATTPTGRAAMMEAAAAAEAAGDVQAAAMYRTAITRGDAMREANQHITELLGTTGTVPTGTASRPAPHATPPARTPFAGAITQIAGPPDDLATEEDGHSLLAIENGRRVGYLHYDEYGGWDSDIVIHHIWVDEDQRGRGVARRMMDALVAQHPRARFCTSEFSSDGSGFASSYATATGVHIKDNSEDLLDDEDDEDFTTGW